MKAAYTVLGYPTTFSNNRQEVNRGFMLVIRPSFLEAAVDRIKEIPEVTEIHVLVNDPKEDREETTNIEHILPREKPMQVLVFNEIGTLLEDVFETVREALDALAKEVGEQHDPTEVILMEVAATRARQRQERQQRSTLGSSAPIPPTTQRRQRILNNM